MEILKDALIMVIKSAVLFGIFVAALIVMVYALTEKWNRKNWLNTPRRKR